LVAPETFKALLRQRWNEDGRKLSAYTHGVAGTLIAIASEWVKMTAETLATLKALRRKLGTLPTGLTQKNQALLRKFDDPRLVQALVDLPDKLWRQAHRNFATAPRRSFVDLQTALGLDLLIHLGLRMENLSSLNFEQHFHWLQGRGKPALVAFRVDETKNAVPLEFEIPALLADRFDTFRNKIVPAVTGARPGAVFVTTAGKAKGQSAIAVAIVKAVRKHLGITLTPHQFRHIVAKILLDRNPGAFELVRQLLGHKNPKTTTRYYAGIDTRRAGRAHAELVLQLREAGISKARRRRTPAPKKE
jgi:integrase